MANTNPRVLTETVLLSMTPEMLQAIDEFRHTLKVPSRSEAIRILIEHGLDSEIEAES